MNMIDHAQRFAMITNLTSFKFPVKPVKEKPIQEEPVEAIPVEEDLVEEKYIPLSEADFDLDDFMENHYHIFYSKDVAVHQLILDKGIRYYILMGKKYNIDYEKGMAFNYQKTRFDSGSLSLHDKGVFVDEMSDCFKEAVENDEIDMDFDEMDS